MSKFTAEKRPLTKSERIRRREKIVSFIVLSVASLLFLFPFIYMLGTSFKSDLDLQIHPETLLPSSGSEWTLKHYEGFIIRDGKVDNMPFWIFNSLWSTAACVVLTILMDLVTAYAVVFFRFRGRNFLVRFLFLWMAVPGVIGTAPSFAMYATFKSALGVTGGAAGYAYLYSWLVIPGVTGIFNVLLMPILTFLAVNWLPLAVETRLILVFAAAFPCAVVSVAVAAKEGRNAGLMAEGVALTTLFSLATLPFIAVFLMSWYC